MKFSVFWSHPYYGNGMFVIDAATAEEAGIEAGESLSEHLADDEEDQLEIASICDDLDVDVWEGAHSLRPDTPPNYVFT